MPTDLHQHLLPEPLIAALARRSAAPRLARDGRGWRLELAGEPASAFDPADHDPAARAAEPTRRTASSSPSRPRSASRPSRPRRPRRCSRPSTAASSSSAGRSSCGAPRRPPADVDALLDAGARGVALPASALLRRQRPRRRRRAPRRPADAILERSRLATRRSSCTPGPAAAAAAAPPWWPALTDYVAQMSAAWHAFAALGRRAPSAPARRVRDARRLRPAARRAARRARRPGRGHPRPARVVRHLLLRRAHAIDSMLRMVGVDRLVHGSDRPVVAAPWPAALGDAVEHALTVANPDASSARWRCSA